jgi:hypothetical protein
MTHKNARIPILKAAMSIFFVVLSLLPVVAQDTSSETLPNTVVEIDANALAPDRAIVVIRDSIGLSLAVVAVSVDGQPVWSRKNNTPFPINGVVEWFFDEPSRQLMVDLSGIIQQTADNARIVIEVAPVNLRVNRYQVLVSSAGTVADARKRDKNTPLTNVNIEFKR